MKGFRSRLRFSFLAVGKTCESRRMDGGGREGLRKRKKGVKTKDKPATKPGESEITEKGKTEKQKETKEIQITPR